MATSGGTFDTNEPLLKDLLEAIRDAEIQLPDFQRGWVWDDNHIRSLIASVTLAYPIGAVMVLQMGGDGVRFLPRLFEGVDPATVRDPESLVLDGQQRLTSLFLALMSGEPVKTKTEKGKDIDRFYYLDMGRCLDPEEDREDAVVSVPATRIVKSDFGRVVDLDLSEVENEYEAGMFPLRVVFDTSGFHEWANGYRTYFGHDPERSKFFDRFQGAIWLPLQQYKVPVIELKKATPKEAVCQVFEKVNTGGVTLSVFELMTATFAADDFRLRDDWDARAARLHEKPVLATLDATAFLTAVTLLTSYRRARGGEGTVSCKRKDVLRLSLEDYKAGADVIEEGLQAANRLLARERIFDGRELPYTTQLIPLGAICAVLGKEFESEPVKQKIARWYWSGVFGELYGGANESRFAYDLPDVVGWVRGGAEPRSVKDASFNPTRLLGLKTRQSAAYKGMMARLMQVGSRDFMNGDEIQLTTYFDQAVDIHHIFPRKHCIEEGLPEQKWNSVVNKAPLTARTNREIGGRAPSDYISRLEEKEGIAPGQLDEILRSHLIEPRLLRTDAFDAFIQNRASALLDLIEQATGKAVAGRDSEEVVEAFGAPLLGAIGD